MYIYIYLGVTHRLLNGMILQVHPNHWMEVFGIWDVYKNSNQSDNTWWCEEFLKMPNRPKNHYGIKTAKCVFKTNQRTATNIKYQWSTSVCRPQNPQKTLKHQKKRDKSKGGFKGACSPEKHLINIQLQEVILIFLPDHYHLTFFNTKEED